jgi:hypothetical protein
MAKYWILRFDGDETQPGTGAVYLDDGSEDQAPRNIEDRSQSP